jgi:hypothetical protein
LAEDDVVGVAAEAICGIEAPLAGPEAGMEDRTFMPPILHVATDSASHDAIVFVATDTGRTAETDLAGGR